MLFLGGPWDGRDKIAESATFLDIPVDVDVQPVAHGASERPSRGKYELHTYRRDELRTQDFLFPFYRSYTEPVDPEECFRRVVEYLHDHPGLMIPR